MAATWERLAEDRAVLVKRHPELAVDGEATNGDRWQPRRPSLIPERVGSGGGGRY